MVFLRLILISALLIFTATESFAASGSVSSGSTNTKIKNTETIEKDNKNDEDNTNIDNDDKKIETNAHKFLLDIAIYQGKNDLKKIVQSFNKVTTNPKLLIPAYTSIQNQFERKRKEIIEKDISDSLKKELWVPYYDYLINSIENIIKNLE